MFNKKEIEELNTAFETVWDKIAMDILATTMENQISKEYVIEVVDDSERIKEFGNLNKELLEKFELLNYDSRIKILEECFVFDFYG